MRLFYRGDRAWIIAGTFAFISAKYGCYCLFFFSTSPRNNQLRSITCPVYLISTTTWLQCSAKRWNNFRHIRSVKRRRKHNKGYFQTKNISSCNKNKFPRERKGTKWVTQHETMSRHAHVTSIDHIHSYYDKKKIPHERKTHIWIHHACDKHTSYCSTDQISKVQLSIVHTCLSKASISFAIFSSAARRRRPLPKGFISSITWFDRLTKCIAFTQSSNASGYTLSLIGNCSPPRPINPSRTDRRQKKEVGQQRKEQKVRQHYLRKKSHILAPWSRCVELWTSINVQNDNPVYIAF